MNVLNLKPTLARRGCSCYMVLLLFVCSLIHYEIISNFLEKTVTFMKSRGHHVKYSQTDVRDPRVSRNSTEYMNLYTDSDNTTPAELPTNTVPDSGVALSRSQTLRTEVNVADSETRMTDLIDKITSDILETMNDTSENINNESYQTCNTTTVIGNSCVKGGCMQLQLPRELRNRVKQIVEPSHLQITHKMRIFLTNMADKVPGYYDFILVSAVSFSHFDEAQAMLYNVHMHLFPLLKNFTFIYYNIGLSKVQRDYIAKICKCHLIDFPFSRVPEFVSFLKCYAWKPFIVNAHISRTNLLFWIDASVRFKNQSHKTLELLDRARFHGVQVFKAKQTVADVTLPSMFHFFGDEACIYNNFPVILSGVTLFRNVMFVKTTILEPWIACAINRECMCPKNEKENLREIRITCHKKKEKYHYGICHRFDQSALSLILYKIYQNSIESITAHIKDYIDIMRGDKIVYPIENITNMN